MREVNYLTDKSQDSEKLLSFKEQILRDLEEANEQLLKIEKEYDLPDRSIETPSSLKEEEEATPPPKEEAVVASTEIPVEPEKATPAVEEKEWSSQSLLQRTKSGTGRGKLIALFSRNQRQQNKRNKIKSLSELCGQWSAFC